MLLSAHPELYVTEDLGAVRRSALVELEEDPLAHVDGVADH